MTTSPAPSRPQRVPPERQLYLGNLPFDGSEQELLELLRRLGLEPVSVHLPLHRDGSRAGQRRGFGFACFETAQATADALVVLGQGVTFLGRPIVASPANGGGR